MTKLRSIIRDQRGAAVIEMAIALPVLIVISDGIFQIGIAFQASAGMQHALGEGARLATLCQNPDRRRGLQHGHRRRDQGEDQLKVFGTGVGTFSEPSVTDAADRGLHAMPSIVGDVQHADQLPVLPGPDDQSDPKQAGLRRGLGFRPRREEGGDRLLDLVRLQPLGEMAVLQLHPLEDFLACPRARSSRWVWRSASGGLASSAATSAGQRRLQLALAARHG